MEFRMTRREMLAGCLAGAGFACLGFALPKAAFAKTEADAKDSKSDDAPANESGSPQGSNQEPPAMPSGDQSQDGQNGQPSDGAPDNGQGGEPPAGGNGEPPTRPDDTQNGQPISDAAQADQSSSATPQTGQPSDGNLQSDNGSEAQASTEFYMQDKVNAFSGVTAAA